MLGNRPAQESELVGPICARFGLTVESSRLLISEGRKVGFVVDCGSLPQSVRCFVEEFPTPSTSLERNTSRGKALCLLPKGFKVVGLVEGSVYLGEVVYDENWKRSYKFHLVEGADIVKSSMPCSNPTSAFKEIEAVIKVHTTKKRQRKPDARSNGKLYMAVMYSATQRLLREKFRGCENKVPEDVRPIFIEWMENRSTNKSMGGLHDATIVPLSMSLSQQGSSSKPSFALPRHSSAPGTIRGMQSSHEAYSDHLASVAEGQTSEEGRSDTFPSEHRYEMTSETSDSSMRRRISRSFDDFRLRSYSAGIGGANAVSYDANGTGGGASRKRSSGSIDEQAPMLLTRKRASGSIDEDSPVYKELETMNQSMSGPPPPPPGAPPAAAVPASLRLADAGELFADCFRLPGVDFLGPPSINSPSASSFLGADSSAVADLHHSFGVMPSHDDLHSFMQPVTPPTRPSTQVTTSDLYHCIRDPDRVNLNAGQIRAFLALLLQVPVESISAKHVDDIVHALSRNGRHVSLDSFVGLLESQEREVVDRFRAIDRSEMGEISVDDLRAAYSRGIISGFDSEMEEMQYRMDGLNVGAGGQKAGSSRAVTLDEFKHLVLPLPSAVSIRTVLETLRSGLNDSLEVDLFSF